MATYAVQFITSEGALEGQTITNRVRALEMVELWEPRPLAPAVALMIVGGNFQERTALGDLAVADVFFNRRDAVRFLNRLTEKQQ